MIVNQERRTTPKQRIVIALIAVFLLLTEPSASGS